MNRYQKLAFDQVVAEREREPPSNGNGTRYELPNGDLSVSLDEIKF
jgi:hypothetical protein